MTREPMMSDRDTILEVQVADNGELAVDPERLREIPRRKLAMAGLKCIQRAGSYRRQAPPFWKLSERERRKRFLRKARRLEEASDLIEDELDRREIGLSEEPATEEET